MRYDFTLLGEYNSMCEENKSVNSIFYVRQVLPLVFLNE